MALPKPFQRPRVEIEAQGRSWQEVSPLQLSVGDIVPDHGRVEAAEVMRTDTVGVQPSILVEVTFLSGKTYAWKATDRIKAFITGASAWPEVEEYFRGQRE